MTGGSPFFDHRIKADNTCDGSSRAHLYLQRRGDGGTAAYEHYRWFSQPLSIELKPGPFALTVPLTGDNWISVLGRSGAIVPAEFDATGADLARVGLTFGGGCFAGHGVRVTGGSARFVLHSMAAH